MQNPISLPPDSEPQPDIVLLRAECARRATVPTAADVLLVIEVADSTLAHDRSIKIPLYARHGILEAWLFDVTTRSTTIFRDPSPEGYRTVLTPGHHETIRPCARPDVLIVLDEVWPND